MTVREAMPHPRQPGSVECGDRGVATNELVMVWWRDERPLLSLRRRSRERSAGLLVPGILRYGRGQAGYAILAAVQVVPRGRREVIMNGMSINGRSMAHWAGSVLALAGLRHADYALGVPRRDGNCLTPSLEVDGTIAAEPPSRRAAEPPHLRLHAAA